MGSRKRRFGPLFRTEFTRKIMNMRHIAILGVQLHGNDADMLRGVFRFARLCPDWIIHDPENPAKWSPAPMGHVDRPAGILANLIDEGVARYCKSFDVPVVNISAPQPHIHDFPTVSTNSEAIGILAVDHLASCGLHNLAWLNIMQGFSFITARGVAFEKEAQRRNLRCSSYSGEFPLSAFARGGVAAQTKARNTVLKWLRELPRPCGIFATTDSGGRELCRLCRLANLNVPEDIAVIGVDDFEFVCETSHPPLSSIRLANEEIGYRAAELLNQLMNKREVPGTTLFEPLGVHVRQSTDVIAVEDRMVARAMAYIRNHARERIGVPDVVRDSATNRRALERRFRECLGRTILQEIHLAHVSLARRLLMDTSLTVSNIAERSGFRDMQHMDLVFRNLVGHSPAECRRSKLLSR